MNKLKARRNLTWMEDMFDGLKKKKACNESRLLFYAYEA